MLRLGLNVYIGEIAFGNSYGADLYLGFGLIFIFDVNHSTSAHRPKLTVLIVLDIFQLNYYSGRKHQQKNGSEKNNKSSVSLGREIENSTITCVYCQEFLQLQL